MADTTGKTTPAKTTPAKTTPAPAAPAPDEIDQAPKGDSREGGNLAVDGDVVGSTSVPGADVDAQDAAIKEAGSWAAEDHVIDEGNFHDPALQGAGTILPGGGYGPPLPDPQVQRKNADPDYQVK